MFDKYFTIVVIPRKTSKMREIKVPIFLFGLGVVVSIGILYGLAYIVFDYYNLRSNLASMDESKAKYDISEKQIKKFSEQYQDVQVHYNHLEALNYKLKSMVMTSMHADKKSKLTIEDQENLAEKLDTAEKKGILEVIASDSSEVDSDLKHERGMKFNNLVKFYKERQNPFSRIPHGWPVNGFLIDEFGTNTDPFTGEMRPQNGIHIASRLDFLIYAPADGIVIERKDEEEYGNVLVIDHGNGFMTRYGHISRFEVEEGELVKKGKIIAQVGNTGRATGPGLYYEVILNGIPQNPVKYNDN